jgi:CDP-diglyceride synthetase
MLKHRILTAIVLALVFASTIFFFGDYGSNVLFSIGLFVAIRELFALTIMPEKTLGIIISILLASLFWLFNVKSGIWLNFYFSFIGSLVWIIILCFMATNSVANGRYR